MDGPLCPRCGQLTADGCPYRTKSLLLGHERHDEESTTAPAVHRLCLTLGKPIVMEG